MQEYTTKFRRLAAALGIALDNVKVLTKFVAGLHRSIQGEMRLYQATNISQTSHITLAIKRKKIKVMHQEQLAVERNGIPINSRDENLPITLLHLPQNLKNIVITVRSQGMKKESAGSYIQSYL